MKKALLIKDLSGLGKILCSTSERWNGVINYLGKSAYYSTIPRKLTTPLGKARANFEKLVDEWHFIREKGRTTSEMERKRAAIECGVDKKDYRDHRDDFTRARKIAEERLEKEFTLEEKLDTFGWYYCSREEFNKASDSLLWKYALEYDKKGLMPKERESLGDFVHRANGMLFFHKSMKVRGIKPEIKKFDMKTLDIELSQNYGSKVKVIKEEDMIEANKRIPYFMDLSWVAAFSNEKLPLLQGALGVCITIPQYYGLSWIEMKDHYKKKDDFLKFLAHEMTHAGTCYLDTIKRDFVETKAYSVGSGKFGEYVVAISKNQNLLYWVAKGLIDFTLRIPLSDHLMRVVPKVISAVKIAEHSHIFKSARKKLTGLYGDKGNYILGRLTADEMNEVVYTNDIPRRLNAKKSLKWRIMNRNFQDF